MRRSLDIRKMTYLAILTAIVVVLQTVFAPMIGGLTGLSPALVLIPIVLGVATCGLGAGAWLGGVFAFIVMFDPTTVPFWEYKPLMTVLLVFLKGIGSGVVAGLLYKLIEKKNRYAAIIAAAISAPIVNTGIFVLGCVAFFLDLTGIAVFGLFITANFGVELVLNAVLVPIIYRILEATKITA